MILYSYWRSSASYRVRIALNLKEIKFEMRTVNLIEGKQKDEKYAKLNPQKRVPCLVDGDHVIAQSIAIIEYLEEKYPTPALLPKSPVERARVRSIAQNIAADISPLGNLGPLKYLQEKFSVTDAQKEEWIRHWITEGFKSLEHQLAESKETGKYCHGDTPAMADCLLVPQVYNARRFHTPLEKFPTILRIAETAEAHPAFAAAHPSKQPDAT